MSFGAIAGDYDRLRPPPAEAAVDWLLPERCQVAIDLGAGTGLLSRALALRVPRLVAVEPDPRMAAVLRERSPGVHVVRGTGEQIPVRDGAADGVFVSAAWHWMDAGRAGAEVWRVLRPGSRFGMVWTTLDHDEGWLDGTDWMRGAGRQDGNGQTPEAGPQEDGRQDGNSRTPEAGPQDGNGRPDRTLSPEPAVGPGDTPEPRPRGRREIMLPDGLFGDVAISVFGYRRTMTIGDIVAMLATYSSVITASPQEREQRMADARAALEQRFPGAQSISVPMRSRCWRADKHGAGLQARPPGGPAGTVP